jgi:hypothetical protein
MSDVKKMWFIVYTNQDGYAQISHPYPSIELVIAVQKELLSIGYDCCAPFSIDNETVWTALAILKRC